MSTLQLGTIAENFSYWEKTNPDSVFLKQPYGDNFTDFTWKEVGIEARKMAAGLIALNLPPKSNIGLISKNCAHWIIADLAIAMSGHVSVPFYATLVADQLNQVLTHSECKVLFIGKLDDWKSMRNGIPENVKCISFPKEYDGSPVNEHQTWGDFCHHLEPIIDIPKPNENDIATIIYTSGTTGVPKGVMLTYGGIKACLIVTHMEVGADIPNPRFFSYLPLCHIAERNIVESMAFITGGTIYFAESLATFAKNLAFAKPTHFLAVPRIWTKFQLGILAKMPQKKLDLLLKIPIISGIIKKKLQTALGLDQAKVILTGAAPMPVSLLKWFRAIGINIREAYGMTENVGAQSLMPENQVIYGSVGKAYKAVTTRIDPITSEIQMKSPWNTIGYYKEPILTDELIKNGWLCTGDMGEIDSEGFIKITGRVKDMFKTAKGEYVVPGPLEIGFANNSFIEQICVAGASLAQPVALLVLSEIGQKTEQAIVSESIINNITLVNQNVKNYEFIKKAIVVSSSWSIENNMLTPTMKIKRNIVENHYKQKMEDWFDHQDTVIFESNN